MGLSDNPFTFQATKDGRLRISRGTQVVMTLGGTRAEKLLQALSTAEDADAQQQFLACATRNYRRGNERTIDSKL